MLSEALTALAAAGGTAVVQAAGTDAWAEVRQAVARLLARENPDQDGVERRLDRTADALAATREAAEVTRHETVWRTHFEAFLEQLEGAEREQAITELRALAERYSAPGRAGGGTLAGNVFHGPTAFQAGSHNRQENHFGPGA